MPGTVLLSAFYFGSAEHYALIARSERVIIDVGEHYERQSFRTRTSIIGPNGKQDLTVSIARRSGEKMPMRTVKLSYVEPWNLQHVQAIRSAYGQTPWFIHFIDEIEAMLTPRYERLIDLDLATMRMILTWLRISTPVELREDYVEDTEDLIDHRVDLHPKRPLPSSISAVPEYQQIFSDRHGYSGRLSILDLLMNTGPEAGAILRRMS